MESRKGGCSSYLKPGLPVFGVISLSSFVHCITHMRVGSGTRLDRRFDTMDIKIEAGVFHMVTVEKCKMGKRSSMDIHRNKSAQCVKEQQMARCKQSLPLEFLQAFD